MIFQQILLATSEIPNVAPPVEVPSGDPFIIDLDFPGLARNITLEAVYTFPQAVSFPITVEGQAFSGSTVTYAGAPFIQMNFYMRIADETSNDTLDLIFTDPPQPVNPDGVLKSLQRYDGIWLDSHASGGTGAPFYTGGTLTFFAGEKLYVQFYYDAADYYAQVATLADVNLHLVGVAV